MHSATSKTPPCLSVFTSTLTGGNKPRPTQFEFTHRNENQRMKSIKSLKCALNPGTDFNPPRNAQNPSSLFPFSSATGSETNPVSSTANKLQRLVSEFKSLPEPIDRVRRLLYHADLLQPFDDSVRVEANRVNGCTTQVWLEARMDSNGLMRFRADSDSELTKGFCSCLIWVLDGGAPEEVLAVEPDDLADMNVGFSGRAHSRVNTWHNILMSMQKRTKALVQERKDKPLELELEPFSSLWSTLMK